MPAYILYLTSDEQKHLFDRLPEALQASWKDKISIEAIDAYETEEELKERMTSVRYDDLPSVKEFMQSAVKAAEAGNLENADYASIPEAAFPRYYHSIGACGMTAMLEFTLHDPNLTEEGMRAVASMSMVRHIILEANASAKAA